MKDADFLFIAPFSSSIYSHPLFPSLASPVGELCIPGTFQTKPASHFRWPQLGLSRQHSAPTCIFVWSYETCQPKQNPWFMAQCKT